MSGVNQEMKLPRRTSCRWILSDLPTYLQFKFHAKVDKEMQGILKDRLFELSRAKVDLDRYLDIVHEIEKNSHCRVPLQEFYKEIDGLIDAVLNPTQLKLVR